MQTQQILDMAKQAGCFEKHQVFYFTSPELEAFAKLVAKAKAEELATELEKGPLNDTATSIAIWIRSQE